MTDLLLIRHATNDWVGDRLAGWTPGVHLNEPGRDQAAALGDRLAAWPLSAIYSSPLERVMETAQAVAGRHDLDVVIEDDVGEARYGDWTGQSIKELAKTPEWLQVQFTPGLARFPNGESLGEMQARAVAAVERLRRLYPNGVVAIFSHADVIKAVAAYYAGMHFDLFQRLVIDTASVTWIRFTPHGPRLLRLNDTGALEPPKSEAGSDQAAAATPSTSDDNTSDGAAFTPQD
ncbi:MAG TPA: MSMEG_4193 family putative phosphomutase [Anaerolineae bacterium]|nr:MSMEG_4193 family putative phosphomutase [Anaerolineae bacterium]